MQHEELNPWRNPLINKGTDDKPNWVSVASFCEDFADIDPDRSNKEPEGTPVTRESLLFYGYEDHAASLTAEELDKAGDPFYFIKGDFKLYDLGDVFYTDASTDPALKGGTKVTTMEQLAVIYEAWTGRVHTIHAPLQDTEPQATPGIVLPLNLTGANLIKAKLKGGPGDGMLISWPKMAVFYLLQVKTPTGKQEGHRYKRKAGTKKTFLYIGPVQ